MSWRKSPACKRPNATSSASCHGRKSNSSPAAAWAASPFPREYGGPQVSFVTLAEVFAIISAADPALGQIPQNQFGILNLVLGSATEAQKKQLFKSVLEGWRIGNAGPERGTKNTLELKARITADGDGFVINGQKFYSTGALFAHWVAVKALNDDGKQVLAFVRRGTPGLRIVDDWSGFGQRTTASGTILLNNVRVDAELVVDNWKINDKPEYPGRRLAVDSSGHRRRHRPWRHRRRHRIRAKPAPGHGSTPRSNGPAMTCT